MIIIYEYSLHISSARRQPTPLPSSCSSCQARQPVTPQFTFIMVHSALSHYGSFCTTMLAWLCWLCQTPSGAMESYIFMSQPIDIVQPQCNYNFYKQTHSKELSIVYWKTIGYLQEQFGWVIIALQPVIMLTNLNQTEILYLKHLAQLTWPWETIPISVVHILLRSGLGPVKAFFQR